MVKKLPHDLCGIFSLQTKKAQSKKTSIKSFLALPLEESYAFCSQNGQNV
jgi:hypothetical protein